MGKKSRPGLTMVNGHVIHGNVDAYYESIKKELPRVKSIRSFDSRSFPKTNIDLFVGVQSLHMDTYDFIRLEKEQIAQLKNILQLDLNGIFVAHHEARKILANISRFHLLEVFATNSFVEPHVDLTSQELCPILENLPHLRSIGVLYDPPSQPDVWLHLPSLPNLTVIAVGLSETNPLFVGYFLGWVSLKLANVRTVYLQLLSKLQKYFR